MHLVGFIIRICHDAARSAEQRQKHQEIKVSLEVMRLIQIAGEAVRVVVNWSLGGGVRERDRATERERECGREYSGLCWLWPLFAVKVRSSLKGSWSSDDSEMLCSRIQGINSLETRQPCC